MAEDEKLYVLVCGGKIDFISPKQADVYDRYLNHGDGCSLFEMDAKKNKGVKVQMKRGRNR